MAHGCETCKIRAYSERKPKSIIAILWRLHTKICPGWRSYQKYLASQQPEQ